MNDHAHHWLKKHSPREWIRAAMAEVRRAEESYAQKNERAGLAGARRAAGMAMNAALAIADEPDARFGRSYVDHLHALARDASVPARVREAATILVDTPLRVPGGLVMLRIGRADSGDERVLEAARDVVAHAYALVVRSESESEAGEDKT